MASEVLNSGGWKIAAAFFTSCSKSKTISLGVFLLIYLRTMLNI
jgi:hypothetical protein